MSQSDYPEKSWIDQRLEQRSSPIHGTGVFATAPIRACQRLVITGGIVFTSADRDMGRVRLDPTKAYNEDQIGEDLWLVNPIDEDMSFWFNHSCDPNFWGDTARRDVDAGEEVTTDYALCIADPSYHLEPCRCGTTLCRGRVTGDDWKSPELQRRYRGHFTAFVEGRIRALHADEEHKQPSGSP